MSQENSYTLFHPEIDNDIEAALPPTQHTLQELAGTLAKQPYIPRIVHPGFIYEDPPHERTVSGTLPHGEDANEVVSFAFYKGKDILQYPGTLGSIHRMEGLGQSSAMPVVVTNYHLMSDPVHGLAITKTVVAPSSEMLMDGGAPEFDQDEEDIQGKGAVLEEKIRLEKTAERFEEQLGINMVSEREVKNLIALFDKNEIAAQVPLPSRVGVLKRLARTALRRKQNR